MIAAVLPAAVATAEAYGDVPDEPVFPGEEPAVARAVESRRREYVTARRCAREALARLGIPPAPVHTGSRREPVWPAGVVGSITHCPGYRAAAVARTAVLGSIGIDAEPHAPLPDGVLDSVTVPAERPRLAGLTTSRPEICWDRLLFSAKEAVYKAWFPLTHRMLGFEEVDVAVDSGGGFMVRLLVAGTRVDGQPPLTGFTGRWRIKNGLILTAVTVAPGLGR